MKFNLEEFKKMLRGEIKRELRWYKGVQDQLSKEDLDVLVNHHVEKVIDAVEPWLDDHDGIDPSIVKREES